MSQQNTEVCFFEFNQSEKLKLFQFASGRVAFLFVNTRLSKAVAMADGSSFNVKLYIYDLSKGLARQLSPMMLGEVCSYPAKVVQGRW